MKDGISPAQRREVIAIAESRARAAARHVSRPQESESEGISRRNALKLGGFGGILTLGAIGSGTAADAAQADHTDGHNPGQGNEDDAGDEEDAENGDDESEDNDGASSGLKNLRSGQWNLQTPQHTVVRPESPPTGTGGPSVSHDGVIYCFGGNHLDDPQVAAYQIKPPSNQDPWILDLETPPAHLGGGSATLKDDKAYVLNTNGFFEYSLPANPSSGSGSWNTLTSPDDDASELVVSGAGLAAANNGIYRFGSNSSRGRSSTVRRFDLQSNGWSNSPAPMPTPKADLAAVEHDGLIYTIGGFHGDGNTRVEVYDPDDDEWDQATVPDLPIGAQQHTLTKRAGKLYVIGGQTTATQVYDFESGEWEWYPGSQEVPARLPAVGATTSPPPWDGIYAFGGGDAEQAFRADVFGSVE